MNMSFKSKAAAVSVLALGAVATAQAALPAAVTTAFTSLNTDVVEYRDAAIPVAATVTLAFVVIGWVKKFISKGAS